MARFSLSIEAELRASRPSIRYYNNGTTAEHRAHNLKGLNQKVKIKSRTRYTNIMESKFVQMIRVSLPLNVRNE